jgi:hypothetical protein
MKSPIPLALCLLFAAAPALAAPAALPDSPSLRAVACAATLTAMAGSVRPTSATMADELAGIAGKWRTKAHQAFAESSQPADQADAQIDQQVAALTTNAGLPSGTFEKAQTCQNEGASLPGQ